MCKETLNVFQYVLVYAVFKMLGCNRLLCLTRNELYGIKGGSLVQMVDFHLISDRKTNVRM